MTEVQFYFEVLCRLFRFRFRNVSLLLLFEYMNIAFNIFLLVRCKCEPSDTIACKCRPSEDWRVALPASQAAVFCPSGGNVLIMMPDHHHNRNISCRNFKILFSRYNIWNCEELLSEVFTPFRKIT